MKNAKRLLSLVLVIAMAFSMMAIASAKPADKNVDDYADFDAINQIEAVDVLTALGVLTGYEDNSFQPEKLVTRAEAAKVICYILLGKSTADALTHSPSSFSDVETASWANPFIEYCVHKGIIKGYGNGTFGPNDNVTGSQIGKMLLMAVGYGVNGEYEGSSWELSTIDKARQLDIRILTGTGDLDFSAPATREQIARYTFNALTIPRTVTWNSILNDYSSWGSVIMVGDQNPTLGVKTFNLRTTDLTNKFGFGQYYYWTRSSAYPITNNYDGDVIVDEFTLTPAMNKGTLWSKGTWAAGVELWVNGRMFDSDPADADVYEFASSIFASRGGPAFPDLAIPGVYMYLVDTDYDGTIDKVIVKYEFLAKVTAVNAAAGTINVEYYYNAGSKAVTGLFAEGFAKGDMVNIIFKEGTTIGEVASPQSALSVVKAEVIADAQITGYTNLYGLTGAAADMNGRPNTITIGGKAYYASATTMSINAPNNSDNPYGLNLVGASVFNVQNPVYFDSFGNIIGYSTIKYTAANLNYAYITDRLAGAFSTSPLAPTDAKVYAKFTDGTAAACTVQVVKGTGLPYNSSGIKDAPCADDTAFNAAFADGWYAYTKNADGTYRFTAIGQLHNPTSNANYEHLKGSVVAGEVSAITAAFTNTNAGGAIFTGGLIGSSSTAYSVVSGGAQKEYIGSGNFPKVDIDPAAAATASNAYYAMIIKVRDADGLTATGSVMSHILAIEKGLQVPMASAYGIITNVAYYDTVTSTYTVLKSSSSDPAVAYEEVGIDDNAADSLRFGPDGPQLVQYKADGKIALVDTTSANYLTCSPDYVDASGTFFIEGTKSYAINDSTIIYGGELKTSSTIEIVFSGPANTVIAMIVVNP